MRVSRRAPRADRSRAAARGASRARRRVLRVRRATRDAARDGDARDDSRPGHGAASADAPFARSSALGVAIAFGLGFAVPSRVFVAPTRAPEVSARAVTTGAIAAAGVDEEAEAAAAAAAIEDAAAVMETREEGGMVVVGLAVATIVSALSAAAYVRRYEIFTALRRRLAELEANDPMYPETKESVWAQLEGEARKREALNEEWAERLMAEKNKSREAEAALRAEMDAVAEGVRAEREANERLRAKLVATEHKFQLEIERAQRERDEIEQKSRAALSEYETERENIEQLRAKLFAAENSLETEMARARQIEEQSRIALAQVEAEKTASVEQLRERLNASESALQAEIERARREKGEIEQKLQLAMSQHKDHTSDFQEQIEEARRERDALAEELRVKLSTCANELTVAKAEIENALRVNESLSDQLRVSAQHGRGLHARESDIERELREEIAALQAEVHSATKRASEALGQYQQLDAALPQIMAAVNRLRSLAGMVTVDSPVIQQEFRITDVPPMNPGEFVVLVGCWNDWNVDAGAVMTPDASGTTYVVSIELSSDIVYEYKCCICTGEQRQPRLWQTGANTGFAIASSLINSKKLLHRATLCMSWVADPKNSPVIMYTQDGEELVLSATKLMMDLPANLIGETIDELSELFTSAMQTFDEEIEELKLNAR